MKAIFAILICIFLLPVYLSAQDQNGKDDEDPFRRDPIFSKPLEEIFQRTKDEDFRADDDREERMRQHFQRINDEGLDLDGSFEAGPYHSNPVFSQYPNLPMIHYNRVNGLFLGIKRERMQWHHYSKFMNVYGLRPHGFVGLSTATGDWEYAAGVEKMIGERQHFMLGAEFHKATATEDYWRAGLIESSVTAFFASYDFPDYHRMEGFGAYAVLRTNRLFEAAFSYNIDDFFSKDVETRFSLFGSRSVFRPNQPIDFDTDEARIQRISAGASFNPRRVILAPKFTFTATGKAEFASNGSFDNDFFYDKYQSEMKFYYNFEPGSLLKWRIMAGAITGEAPLFKQFQLGGIGSMRATPYKSRIGNQMFLSNVEAHFGKKQSNSSNWISFSDFHITLFLDSGWTGTSEKLKESNNPFSGLGKIDLGSLRHDAGIGAGSGLIRFELAWPLDSFDRSPALWVRFNPTF